jgi:hypothetical protein
MSQSSSNSGRLGTLLPALIALVALAVAVAALVIMGDIRSEMRQMSERLDAREEKPEARPRPRPRPVPPPFTSRSGPPADRFAGAEGPMPGAGPRLSPAEARAKAEQWVAETREEFANEPKDPVWAAKTEAALVDASVHEDLADTVDKMQSFNVECRSRRCLLEVRFADRGSALDWVGIYLLNADPIRQATHQLIMNPDGTATIVLIGGP